jgi:hypothetical protein
MILENINFSNETLQDLLKSDSVALFSDLSLNPYFQGLELELISSLVSMGNTPTVISCKGLLPWCYGNPEHKKIKCDLCVKTRTRGQDLAGVDPSNVFNLKIDSENKRILDKLALETSDDVTDMNDVKELTFKGIKIGPGIAATLSHTLKNPQPDLELNSNLLHKLIQSSLYIVQALPELLGVRACDKFVVANGRLATNWTASRVAESLGLQVYSYEYLVGTGHLQIVPSSPVHDIHHLHKRITACAELLKQSPAVQTDAEIWFEDNRYPKQDVTKDVPITLSKANRFIEDQSRGLLPNEFNPEMRNIAVFLSSEWEYAALPGWENLLGESQLQVISKIISEKSLDQNLIFWIRAHPHSTGNRNLDLLRISELQDTKIRIIPPESEVDTYALLEASEKVLTFGSTVGVEAAYWGKPSILCGRADYENLDCCYRPVSVSEIVDLLNDTLAAPDRSTALPFALLRLEQGIPLTHVSINFPNAAEIHGVSTTPRHYRIVLPLLDRVLKIRRRIKSKFHSLAIHNHN